MKKLCILLAILFALSCLPAMAAEGDAALGLAEDNRLSFMYCFSTGDTLYLVDYVSLYTYHVGDTDMKEYMLDTPELDMENGSFDIATLPFADGDKLYALNLITQSDENTRFYGANIAEMTLTDDGETAFGNSVDADWSSMIEEYDDNTYPIQPDSIIGASGKAVVRYYDYQDECFKAAAVDIQTGEFNVIDALNEAQVITAYKDGKVLVELYSYDVDTDKARLVVYDPAGDSVEALGEIDVEEYSPLVGLGYDAATDTVYCIRGGEVCPVDIQGRKIGEGVTDMPIDVGAASAACVLDGGYFAFCGEGAVVRNLDISQKAQTRLKINDTSWSDAVSSAFYRFSNAHGDISVVLSREYSEVANLVESMMNRDSSVDVYVISTTVSSYDALFKRGYLMELDGSDKVKALFDSMYPSLRDGLCVDGHPVAVPLMLNGWGMGINTNLLNAMGMKLEDVPDNWSDFLDFIAGLGDALNNTNGASLFYSGCTVSDAKDTLFTAVLEDYMNYVNFTNPGMGYDTELLRGLVAKVESIDYEALGCIPDEDAEDDMYGFMGGDAMPLIQTSTGCCIGNSETDYTCIVMRVVPDAPALLVLDAMVAVVNPYTKNPEAAMAFIDELVENLPKSVCYALNPSLNEAIRGDVNKETLQETQEELDELRAAYEGASSEEKQSLEQDLANKQREYDDLDAILWDVSPREIEWYRAHDKDLRISGFNWLYAEEEGGEAEDLLDQYREGQISATDMLTGIDKKLQMMLMEGN